MHIGLLFFADTLIMANSAGGVKGRAIANNDFLKALLTEAKGHKVSVIISSSLEKQLFEPFLNTFKPVCELELIPLVLLEQHLAKFPLDILHVMDVNLHKGFHIRSHIAKNVFPVTGMTHTLGHAPNFEWMLSNLASQPQPFDALICTTPTAREVITTVQKEFLSRLVDPTPLRTEIIPLGVFTERFIAPTQNLRSNLGLSATDTILLSVGRLSNITKVDLIPHLLAFKSIIAQTQQKIFWLIAGAGEHQHYVKFLTQVIQQEGLEKHVKLIPNPDEAQKLSLYQTSDVFIALSDNTQETFGLSVIEAQASGLPTVASDWDGYRFLVQEGETGFLIPTLSASTCHHLDNLAPLQRDSFNQLAFAQGVAIDHKAFAHQLLKLIEQVELRQKMAQKSRVAASNFDWKKVIKRYLNLWEHLIQESKSYDRNTLPVTPWIPYHKAFASYPSAHLTPDQQVQKTARGEDALTKKITLYRLYDMEEILDMNLLATLLKATGKTQSISDCHRGFPDHAPETVDYHILWALKMGLLALSP